MSLTNPNTWTTREGQTLDIKKMATPHLLSTIHMIERNRLNNLMAVAGVQCDQDVLDYYSQWPAEYEALCEEAERRNLIHRFGQREGLVKSRRK